MIIDKLDRKSSLSGHGSGSWVSRWEKSEGPPLLLCVRHCSRDTARAWDKDIIHPLRKGPGGNMTRVHYELLCLGAPNHVIVLTTSRWVRVPGFQDFRLLLREEISEHE